MKRLFTLFSVFILMLSAVCMTACGGNKYLVSDLGIIELRTFRYVNLSSSGSNFTFTGDNEDDYCVCTIEKGHFRLADGSTAHEITLRSNETGKYVWERSRKDVNFISITVKDDEHIIGYAVIKLAFRNGVIMDCSFPKVDGKYQDITQKQVNKILENVRKLNKDYNPLDTNMRER